SAVGSPVGSCSVGFPSAVVSSGGAGVASPHAATTIVVAAAAVAIATVLRMVPPVPDAWSCPSLLVRTHPAELRAQPGGRSRGRRRAVGRSGAGGGRPS